jgi:hypothetical protein
MQRHERTRRAYRFLADRARRGEGFTERDLARATGWKLSTVRTYLDTRWHELVADGGARGLVATPHLLRLDEEDFVGLASQKRQVFSGYERVCYREVVIYEFLLPLTREAELRLVLDEMFFADTVHRRLRETGIERLERWCSRDDQVSDDEFLSQVAELAAGRFGGYSIAHVSGRYRRGPLLSRRDAAERFATGERYLVDETTAVVRFTVPVKASRRSYSGDFDEVDDSPDLDDFRADVALIHHLFFALFVESVVALVSGEDEIWLYEEWSAGRRLYVFSRTDAGEGATVLRAV